MSSRARRVTVGELIAAFLEAAGVRAAFGVISIHNMPILDAFGRRAAAAAAAGQPAPIRFVPARSEPGSVNMADAHARVSDCLGVAVTSTGTAAGNAAGALIEALTAGTPLLHLTGQIESAFVDRDLGYIHEAPAQLDMLRAVSKAAFRVRSSDTALGTLREAARLALTPPCGPVSVEIPIDIQAADVALPDSLAPAAIAPVMPDGGALDALAERLALARRPLIWLGGGARHAGTAARRMIDLGFGVVTSAQGRGVVPEDHPRSLGAFNLHGPIEKFYETCDGLLVVGSRLRSNETLTYKLNLPRPLFRVDVDPQRQGRGYGDEMFVRGDGAAVLAGLADRLAGRMSVDPQFGRDLVAARNGAEAFVRDGLGPYGALVDAVQGAVGRDFVWVRDITLSNSIWGNRLLRIFDPRAGVHALGGGIGQALPMAIGAALAAGARKTLCLAGDGGLQVNSGELATLVQERANVTLLVMNDRGYGVIRNIQDASYGGRRCYVDLHTPDFAALANSVGLPFERVTAASAFGAAIASAINRPGAAMVEIDMTGIGPFARVFAGPPARKA